MSHSDQVAHAHLVLFDLLHPLEPLAFLLFHLPFVTYVLLALEVFLFSLFLLSRPDSVF